VCSETFETTGYHDLLQQILFLFVSDSGQVSKPTNHITNTLNLVVKVFHMFSGFERSGEWYNTAGMLIMSCLEMVFKNMTVTSITAAVQLMSRLSDCVLHFLQVNPLQDGTTKFWYESLLRMWKCYFSFIETYIPQKSVKDSLLCWMTVLVEAGFKLPQQEIRHTTITFWENIVVPAFAKDNTDAPEFLKEARRKSEQTVNTSYVVRDSTCSLVDYKEKPSDSHSVAVYAFPEETVEVCTVKCRSFKSSKEVVFLPPIIVAELCLSISLSPELSVL
jgi:hypothetical protein